VGFDGDDDIDHFKEDMVIYPISDEKALRSSAPPTAALFSTLVFLGSIFI